MWCAFVARMMRQTEPIRLARRCIGNAAAADSRGHRIIRLLAVATIAIVGVGILPTMGAL